MAKSYTGDTRVFKKSEARPQNVLEPKAAPTLPGSEDKADEKVEEKAETKKEKKAPAKEEKAAALIHLPLGDNPKKNPSLNP